MLMPSIFGESFFDDFFGTPSREYFVGNRSTNAMMQTDIAETDNSFEVTMKLPGFKKEDVKGELKDGYLIISATTNTSSDQKDHEGRYIRRERYSGSCSRSFYVGEALSQEDISAKFEDGTLKLSIPKKEKKPEVEQAKYIAITG